MKFLPKYKTFHSRKCIWKIVCEMAAILSRGRWVDNSMQVISHTLLSLLYSSDICQTPISVSCIEIMVARVRFIFKWHEVFGEYIVAISKVEFQWYEFLRYFPFRVIALSFKIGSVCELCSLSDITPGARFAFFFNRPQALPQANSVPLKYDCI